MRINLRTCIPRNMYRSVGMAQAGDILGTLQVNSIYDLHTSGASHGIVETGCTVLFMG